MPVKSKKSQQEHYWKNLIAGFTTHDKVWLEGFEVPPKSRNPNHDQFAIHVIPLQASMTTQLKKFAKSHQLQLNTLIHAAWGLLLNRYASSDDIIYGVMYFNEINKKITLFNPSLPVRSTLQDETILEYLNKLETELDKNQKNISTYQANQNELFAKLYSYLLLFPQKKVSRNLKKSTEKLDYQQFPLILNVRKLAPLKLILQFNIEKFSKKSIENLAEHYILILGQILANSKLPVTHFSILTKKEKSTLLNDWNKTQQSRVVIQDKTYIQDLFIQQAQRHPDNLAVTDEKKSLSYRELNELSNQIAHFLIHKKVRSGDTVALMMDRTPTSIAAMLGIFKVGATYVPINPKYPDDRIRFILTDCNTHVILVNNAQRIPHEFLYKTALIDEHYTLVKNLPVTHPTTNHINNDIAYLIYTAGVNSHPKGVMIKHESLLNLVDWYKSTFSIAMHDRASQFASHGFDSYFCETIPFLSIGASIHIVNDNIKLAPNLFIPWLVQHNITIVDLPTAYAQIILNLPLPESSIRMMKLGGEAFTQKFNQTYSFDIWNTYGCPETTVEAIYAKIFHANIAPDKQPIQYLPLPIGKPITNSEVYLVDQHLEPVPLGSVGELLIGGIPISPGYLNNPQLTQEKFIPNIFSKDRDAKLYRTGDLARWHSDGNLEFVDRMNHQVQVQGYRVELNQIETAINQFPDISDAVVITNELPNGKKTLIAYLVPNLDKLRIPFQQRCLIALNEDHYLQVLTDDISKEGIAVTGLSEEIPVGTTLKFNIKLPGTSQGLWLSGKLMWQMDHRAGILLDDNAKQKKLFQKSVEYYLSSHNLMDTLQSAITKRNLRKALAKTLPAHMIPTVFTVLPQFPYTFNGKVDWKALPPPKYFDRLLERSYIPPSTPTEKIIAELWADVLHQHKVSMTDNFFDLGGNSILAADLSTQILQRFDLILPEKIFLDLPFVPIMAEYIDAHGDHYPTHSPIQDTIAHDITLQDDLVPNRILSKSIDNPEGILLTGSPGFLGVHLLQELLTHTDARIYCLVRKGEFESVAQRLAHHIERYELNADISLNNRRIIIIPSDIGLSQFGLSVENYNNLCEKIDLIIHCSGRINTMTAYTNLRTRNVQETIEIIKFATQKFDKPIHYVSTLHAVSNLDVNGHLVEEFPDADGSHLVGGQSLSKWVSERLLAQVKNRGLPVTIYRCGHMLGHSITGNVNLNEALLLLIKGCIQLGYAPNWNDKITFLPIDFVSQMITRIVLQQGKKSDVFNLDHPQGILWTDLIAWLNNSGYNIKLCSHAEWLEHLTEINANNALYAFLPHYLSQATAPQSLVVNMEKSIAFAHEANLVYPQIDDRLLQVYLNYLCKAEFLPLPQGKKRQVII